MFPFMEDLDKFIEKMKEIKAIGGGDTAEDIVGGLENIR